MPHVKQSACSTAARTWANTTFASHLIRLGNVSKYSVHHAHKHAVLERVSRVLDDGNDVRAGLGHVNQVSAGTVRKLNRVHAPRRPCNVRDVRNSGAGGCAQVKHLRRGMPHDEQAADTFQPRNIVRVDRCYQKYGYCFFP